MENPSPQAYAEALDRIEQCRRKKNRSLDLGLLRLTTLPPEIGRLTKLTSLALYANQLAALPPEIGLLTDLTELSIGNNRLAALPPEIGRLTKLTSLRLENNQLVLRRRRATHPPSLRATIGFSTRRT